MHTFTHIAKHFQSEKKHQQIQKVSTHERKPWKMNTKGTALGKVVAAVGAVALTFAGLLGGATIAQAAPVQPDQAVGPDQPGHPESGSLTIHKYVGAEGGRGDGTEQNIEGKEPLAGAEFTIWQLGKNEGGACKALDLSTYEAWTDLPKSAPKTIDEVQKTFCLVNANGTAQTTEANGETKFSDLPLGFYYVQETKAPANIVSKTAPFYLSIPLPHEKKNWIYDVHAYPKNQKGDAPKKEINADGDQSDNGVTVGSVVEWTITQVVPALNDGEKYTSASIWDYLPDSLGYVETTEVSYDGTPLALNTDYTLDQDGQNLTWKLTDARLGQLEAGKTITVKFKTKVLKVTESGDIENPGSDNPKNPGYGSEFNGNKIPGDTTPHTYWGQLVINKTDNSTPAHKLAGAQFKVFDNYQNGACPALPATGEVATGTSDAQGVVQWEGVDPTNALGLWIANSPNGPLNNPSKHYCVYETKVPAGYSASADGIDVEIKPGTQNKVEKTVVNPKKDGPDLPLTGAGGTLLLSIIGVGLAAAGVTLAVVSRRKHQN